MPRLLLIRHCQAAWSEDQVLRPLSELGVIQAKELSAWLQRRWPVDAIVSSPYHRAIQTIRPFATASGLGITLDERLRERDTPFLPAGVDHIAATEACFADHSLRLGSAETGLEAQARGWAVIESALQSGYELPALATHGQLLSFTLARIDGTSGVERWRAMTTPDVLLLESPSLGEYRVERVLDY
jgi:2,3-bisphosphoglycerate-dependent phosphoglycerate mutase